MGFADSFDEETKDMGRSDYYKFKENDNRMRIMTEPKIKVSRYGFGVCYEGAPFCKKEVLEVESKQTGKEVRLDKKWEVWAIIRGDKKKDIPDKFAIVDLPYTIAKEIKEYMSPDSEYHFENFPMPFDIKVKAENAGKTTVKYSIQPGRANTECTPEELEELSKKMPIETIIEKQKEKSRLKYENSPMNEDPATRPGRNNIDYPKDEINPDDIPF